MPGYDILTSVDLSLAVGRFVRFAAGTKTIEVNTAPGTDSLGVLDAVATIGASQYGHVVESADLQRIECDANVIPNGARITNDAAGAAIKAVGPDVVSALARFPSLGGEVLAQVLTSADPSGPVVAQPATQVVWGTGAGVSSDPNFRWDSATASLEVSDLAGNPLFVCVGTVASRGVAVLDSAGFVISATSNVPGSRQWRTVDSLGDAGILIVNTDVLVRTVQILDDIKDPIWTVFSRAATRLFAIVNPVALGGFSAFEVGTATGAQYASFNDVGNGLILAIDEEIATRKLDVRAPIFSNAPIALGGFTLANANLLTAALGKVEGSTCYITNGLKPTEVAPGTGVPAYYSAGGPAGAGWYNYGLATLVAII